MIRSLSISTVLVLGSALVFGACTSGESYPDGQIPGQAPDPGPMNPPDPVTFSGSVVNWKVVPPALAPEPVPGVALQSAGLTAEVNLTAGLDGSFSFDQVPANASFSVMGTLLDYRPTHNLTVNVKTVDLTRDLVMLSDADAVAQYAAANVDEIIGTSIVIAELLKGDGTPREGVLAENISLSDGQVQVGDGPFFIGLNGDIDINVLQSTAVNGKAQVVFLNVPVDVPLTLSATYPQDNDGGNGGGNNQPKTATLTGAADSAMIVRVNDK